MESNKIEVSRIQVPTDRFRPADKPTVEALADSLIYFGQLVPVIVDRDLNLIDGLHRYEAVKLAELDWIDVVYQDNLDEYAMREIELESNIRRKQMTWQEEQKAIATLHELKVAKDPNWTQAQTGELAGVAGREVVNRAIKLTKMMELFPELAKADNVAQAMRRANDKAKTILRTVEARENPTEDNASIEERVLLGDSVDVIKAVPSESFHAIITDPPFGIDYDAQVAGTKGELTAYEDGKSKYERILTMAPDLYRVLRPDGWLIWFLGFSWYERCKKVFRDAGFAVDEIPIVWDRSDGRCFTNRPDRYFTKGYDIALHCRKGDATIIQRNKSNILRFPPVQDKETLVERPVELYSELIRRLTVPGEVVADFFVGSGSCLAAAAMNKRDYFGVELDPHRRSYAITKIKAHTPDGGEK